MARYNPQVTRSVTFRERDLPGLLDMLRYDQCSVERWTHETGAPAHGGDRFTVELRSAPGRTPGFEFTYDRWRSFGLYPVEVQR